MKAILTTIVAILFSGVIWGQEIDRTSFLHKSKSMGLVAYLTHIKYDAEFKMAILVNHPEYEKQKNKAEQMNANYNLLKLSVDKLVNQMSADLYNRNFLKLYRETDDFVKTKKKLSKKFKQYEVALKDVEILSEVLYLKSYSGAMAGPTYTEIFSGGMLALNAVNSARDFRRKKVEAIVDILNLVKLEDISKLKQSKDTTK